MTIMVFFGANGIAAGHIRFSSHAQWQCVPYGTIIVIYNAANPFPGIVIDETDANDDNVYFLPSNSSFLEGNLTIPSGGTPSATYAGAVYTPNGAIWDVLGMQNANDGFQTVSPSFLTGAYHSISWGSSSGSTIYFAGSASSLLFQNANLVDNNPNNQANWNSAAENLGTPGAANNANNAAWINAMQTPATNCNFTCTYQTILSDSYEYDTVMPGIVSGTFIHTIPRGTTSPFIGKARTGTRFAYFNFQGAPGSIFYNRYIDVCPNTEFRYSFWIRQFDNNPGSNITINVYDGPNNTFPLLNTQNIINSGTTYNQRVSSIIMASGNIVTIEFIDNVGGPVVGNDLCFDDFKIEMCMLNPLNLSKSYCNTSAAFNLYDEILNTVGTSGTWNGPSALANAHLGTFNPGINNTGIYTYTVAGSYNCSDTVIAINTSSLTTNQGTLNLSSCDSVVYNTVAYYVSQSILDTLTAGASNGCDSVLQVNMTVNQSSAISTVINDTICSGDSIFFNNQWRYVLGNYLDTLATSAGCDSIVSLHLMVQICTDCAIDLGNDTLICGPVNLVLDAGTFDSYLWQNGSTNQTFTATNTGQFWCQGSNFDTTNLVVNAGFESGNVNFTTNYTVGTGGPWGLISNAGTYAISTSPNLVHSNFASCSDHGPGNGNMMIVNGSNTANQSVWCQNISVTPNTDYYFSIWAMSLENTNAANVASLFFKVNNVQIGTNFSPSFTSCNWQQYNQTWNSGANTSVDLCIFNHTIAGNNDFAIDDIFFGEVCIASDTINIISEPSQVVLDTISICSGDSASIFGQFQTLAGLYNDTLVSAAGCDSLYLQTQLLVSTILSSNQNISICFTDSVFLQNAWQNTAGTYIDTLTSAAGCDSLVLTNLTVFAAATSDTVQICSNNALDVGTILFNTVLNSFGCDSVFEYQTTILASLDSLHNISCTNVVSQALNTIDTFTTTLGCDSFYLHTTVLYIAPASVVIIDSCTNNSALAVNFTDTLFTSLGCDSIYQFNTIRYINPDTTYLANICTNDATQATTNYVNTLSVHGCDSFTVAQNVVFVQLDTAYLPEINICFGESETIFGVPQSQSGVYENSILSNLGCDSLTQYQTLIVNPLPLVFAGSDTTINEGENVILEANGANTYSWSNGETGSLISVSPFETTYYTVIGADTNTCIGQDSITVFVITEDILIHLPTGFSPNGDGVNDLFRIVNENLFEDIYISVYNRWGERVFESTKNNTAWDGTYKNAKQPNENYVYYVEAKAKKNQQAYKLSGSISLIR